MSLLADIPSFYMNKISFGPRVKQGPGRIRLDNSVQDNLEIIALKLGKRVQDLTVVILDRPRHERLIHDVRRAGAAIRLISDGDIAAAIAPCLPGQRRGRLHGHRRLARSGPRGRGDQMPRRRDPRADVAARRRGTRSAQGARRDRRGPGEGLHLPTTWPAATASSSPPPASATRRCSRASATRTRTAITHSILMRAKHQTIRYIQTVHNLDLKTMRLRSDAQDHAL